MKTNEPTLSLICAMAHGNVIGKGNDLPWNIPNDLEHFRTLTKGKPVVMGRLTYESILMRRNGKPLPGRPHYVVTRRGLSDGLNGIFMCANLISAIDRAMVDHPQDEIFIIGGASIYKQSIPLVQKMYLTFIDMDIEGGDAFFPDYNPADWVETQRDNHPFEPIPYQFVTLERK